jgi:uncharacterized membrane protein YcaP (DUF421 family)
MKPEDVKLWDWERLFLGEVPPAFILEVVVRMALVYVILMVSMRILGKRMSAQFTRNELAALVSLAAAIGVPILAPDRGVLPAVVIAIVVVTISKVVAQMSAKNEKVEKVTQGTIDTLVSDGVMDFEAMRRTRISKERIMAQLRSENLLQMGEVKRLYLEANGSFTLIKNEEPYHGLAVIPEGDPEFLQLLRLNRQLVCHECGNLNESRDGKMKCANCGNVHWVASVESALVPVHSNSYSTQRQQR